MSDTLDGWGKLQGSCGFDSHATEFTMARSVDPGKGKVWRLRIRRFQKSRLTVAQFCREEGISPPSFYQWRKRLAAAQGEQARGGAEFPQPFVPVRVMHAAAVEIHLPNGARLCLPAGDADTLRVAIEAAGRLAASNEPEGTTC
jgi:hypothetical protein